MIGGQAQFSRKTRRHHFRLAQLGRKSLQGVHLHTHLRTLPRHHVQNVAGARGLPVPAVFPDQAGDLICERPEGTFVLSEYVPGRLHEPGTMPARAARNLGATLARLHIALENLPAGEPPVMPSLEQIEVQLRSLLQAARSRHDSAVDAVAAGVLEAKLDLLATIDDVPALPARWTHGDYEWRNVLFDDVDEVTAVIDFDDAQYYSPARDVMRCIALSFPNLEPEVDDYFAGYVSTRGLTREDAESYVAFYRYISTFRVWPMIDRYRNPERYQSEWDALIQPLPEWDWLALSERFAEIAATVGPR